MADAETTNGARAINPWPWSAALGYDQARLIEAPTRWFVCAGQTAVDATGAPQHAGDMRAQTALALDNLEAVLAAGGMGWTDVVRLAILTTDVDEAMRHMDVLGARLGAVGATPPQTLLGVTRLALPDLVIELEATAAR